MGSPARCSSRAMCWPGVLPTYSGPPMQPSGRCAALGCYPSTQPGLKHNESTSPIYQYIMPARQPGALTPPHPCLPGTQTCVGVPRPAPLCRPPAQVFLSPEDHLGVATTEGREEPRPGGACCPSLATVAATRLPLAQEEEEGWGAWTCFCAVRIAHPASLTAVVRC